MIRSVASRSSAPCKLVVAILPETNLGCYSSRYSAAVNYALKTRSETNIYCISRITSSALNFVVIILSEIFYAVALLDSKQLLILPW